MSTNTEGPQWAAASRKNGLRDSALATPPAQSGDLNEELEAKILVGNDKDGESSDVSTLVVLNVLSASSTKDGDQEEAEALDIEFLIKQMNLDNWRCGGCTLNGEPCQRPISEKRQVEIRSQLNQIWTLSQKSKDLDIELDALIMFVHCWSHDHGYVKEDRLELWAKIFPQGSASPTAIIGKQIKKALGRVEQQCLGRTLQHKRCRRRIGGQRVQNCCKTIDKILQPDVHKDAELLEGYLKVLEANMYCPSHVDRHAYTRVSTWKSSIIDILEKSGTELAPGVNSSISPLEDEDEAINSKAISESTDVTQATVFPNGQLPTPRNTRSLSPEFYDSPSKFWPSSLDASVFQRLPRLDGVPTRMECYGLVEKTVTRNLAKTHNVAGYVYLYEVEGNEGIVKIGYTKALKQRHEEWRFDCNRETRLLYPLSKDDLEQVPNAARVEALCHSELDYCRIRVHCGACLKAHIEWFEISPEKCIQVIKKWSQWMRKGPFENVMTAQRMLLKKEEQEKTKDMVKFMKSVAMLA